MTSCLLIPHPKSPRFHLEAEVVEVALEHLALVAHRGPPGPRVTQALRDLRAIPVSVVLPDQKAHEVFRVPLDLLAVEREEPLSLVPKDLGVQLDLRAPQDLRVTMVFQVLLAPPEQMVNPDPRGITVQSDPLALLDRRVLPDLLESVARPVRMQSLLSSTSISPRMRHQRPTVRRLTLKTLSDRQTHSRTAHGTTLQ